MWIISGNGNGLRIGIDNQGNKFISSPWYNANHEIVPVVQGARCRNDQLSGTKCSWTLFASNAVPSYKKELIELCRINDSKVFNSEIFYLKEPSSIGITCIFPANIWEYALDSFKIAITNPNIKYSINLGFLGFKGDVDDNILSEHQVDTPSFQEFLNGKFLFSNSCEFHIENRAK